MSSDILIAVIAGLPPTLAAVLAFLSSRAVHRQVATPGEVPIGALVERVERRVEALEESVGGLLGRLGHLEGREVLPLQLGRRVERLDEDLRGLQERVARMEGRGAGA